MIAHPAGVIVAGGIEVAVGNAGVCVAAGWFGVWDGLDKVAVAEDWIGIVVVVDSLGPVVLEGWSGFVVADGAALVRTGVMVGE